MKYLLYYDAASAYTAEQVAAGGDGSKVVSVVDGVAWCEDSEKTYYRYSNKSEDIFVATITVHHRNVSGYELISSTTVTGECFSGMTTKIFVAPANIDGYKSIESGKTVTISGATASVDFVYRYDFTPDYSKPLTFEILTDGYISWRTQYSGDTWASNKVISYSKNKGERQSIRSSYNGTHIDVSAGDIVEFFGNNDMYGQTYNYVHSFSGTTAEFNLKGNIMSLISSNNFENLKSFPTGTNYNFRGLFNACKTLKHARELLLPAEELTENCYDGMFEYCTNLLSAPNLPATSLASGCYSGMFGGCINLVEAPESLSARPVSSSYWYMFRQCSNLLWAPIILNAIPGLSNRYYYFYMFTGCTNLCYVRLYSNETYTQIGNVSTGWLEGVSETGVFEKSSRLTGISSGKNGIPTGWTVVDVD